MVGLQLKKFEPQEIQEYPTYCIYLSLEDFKCVNMDEIYRMQAQ